MTRSISGANSISLQSVLTDGMTNLSHDLYPVSNPLPVSMCPKAHQPAKRDSLCPPRPLVFPCAEMAAIRSKKSVMICTRALDSTLIGIKVVKASRANPESGLVRQVHLLAARRTLFADLEHLIRLPCDNTTRQSSPAPFHDTNDDLRSQ